MLTFLVIWELGCDQPTSEFGPGLDLQLQVETGQVVRGSLSPDQGGPAVSQILRPQPEVARGELGVVFKGRLAPQGVAIHVQAEGDPNHWVIPALGHDFVVPNELQWSMNLGFSYAIVPEQVRVFVQAADAKGTLGPISETAFYLRPEAPPAKLLVSLAWDSPTDVDLHLALPDGTVVGAKNPNSYEPPPPGQVDPPDLWKQGGWHDFDSNQQCRLDLRNRENILWQHGEPPKGRYRIYASLFASCDQPAVNMRAIVWHHGRVIQDVGTTMYEFDSRIYVDTNQVPGLLMAEFEVQ